MNPAASKQMPASKLTPQEYQGFQRYLERVSGIVLGDNKEYLVASRLGPIMRHNDIASMSELLRRLDSGREKALEVQVVDAMTTNETSWFRDAHPYRILRDVILPELADSKRPVLRVWSAACSSGQEPYSISMVVEEFKRTRPGALRADVQIIATDISSSVLEAARQAKYDRIAVGRGLDPNIQQRYFRQVGDHWELTEAVRKRVQFRQLNLLQSYALLGRFDVIFCRNVLIYFSMESKQDILRRMTGALNRGGYLFLGGSESPGAAGERFDMQRHGGSVVYRLKD